MGRISWEAQWREFLAEKKRELQLANETKK